MTTGKTQFALKLQFLVSCGFSKRKISKRKAVIPRAAATLFNAIEKSGCCGAGGPLFFVGEKDSDPPGRMYLDG